ncbi:putative effector protein [Ceratobasidium theobromae]|uniref:Putative effector protein n=1 Tax=Ceratobasidium theobromae TaxID=1582974 RepID=A0A5N5QLZ1_9AGAM|nr:putative effector protein [Ceratobasidium theobromae]
MMHSKSLVAGVLLLSCTCASATEHTIEKRAAAKVYTSCTQPKTIAITFDDGPDTYTKTIVDTLDKAGGKATFFFNGKNFNCIYDTTNSDRVKYAFDRGHQVASHTWAHLHLPTLTDAQITSEFSRTNDAIKKITGAVPAFVRPPFGEYNTNVQTISGNFQQSLVTWDFDSQDWNGATTAQMEAAFKAKIDANPNSILPLSHERFTTSALEVLPWLINYAKSKGYKLVTVAECVGAAPYLSRGNPSPRDSSWVC